MTPVGEGGKPVVAGLVSTVIPCRNRPDLLREAVASVLAQTYRPVEVLIVDDGSTDETRAVAEELSGRNAGMVRCLHQEASGPGRAREAGRCAARGEFIQYLDSDDCLLPEKFATQVAALQADPGADIAYGITRLVDANGSVLVDPFKWTGRRMDYLFPGLLVDRWWCTHTPLYRRELCDRIGPWSDLRYSQDWEYDARAGALRARLAWCNRPVSHHRRHAGVRQTGRGAWLTPADRAVFFGSLYECAKRAGVASYAPEMRHFSRWVFYHARRCGAVGESASAGKLLALAARAAGGPDASMRLLRRMAGVIGWRSSSRLCNAYDRFRGTSASRQTLPQSWMPRDASAEWPAT